jgi:hypothetical protein
VTFIYADTASALRRLPQPLSRGQMRHGDLRPIEGPDGIYTMLARALDGTWSAIGSMECDFHEAHEILDIYAETSTELYSDFRLEMRQIA